MVWKSLRTAVIATVLFTVLTGVIYPLAITGLAQVFFPWRANGSLIHVNGKTLGSELIGQPFTAPGYFWSRQSATSPFPYNAASSGATNEGPLNPSLADGARKRIHDLREVDSLNLSSIPVDLVTASASGLDPHISVAAALYQAPRVARARGISLEKINELVARETEGRTFGILGENRVNVLLLNAALDAEPSQLKGN
jgi:K+-transporting ATPase ATPase C chain